MAVPGVGTLRRGQDTCHHAQADRVSSRTVSFMSGRETEPLACKAISSDALPRFPLCLCQILRYAAAVETIHFPDECSCVVQPGIHLRARQ